MPRRVTREYLRQVKARYDRTSFKCEKTVILDEFCEVSGYSRKHAIRLLGNADQVLQKRSERRGRKPEYRDFMFLSVVCICWRDNRCPGARQLHSLIPKWISDYEQKHGPLDKATRARLCRVSCSSLQRIITLLGRSCKK